MTARKRKIPAQGARLAVLDTFTATLDDMITSVAAELSYLQNVRAAFGGVQSAIAGSHAPKRTAKKRKSAKTTRKHAGGTLGELVYSAILAADGPLNRNDIAKTIHRKPQDVSNALTDLRKRKLIERTQDAKWHAQK